MRSKIFATLLAAAAASACTSSDEAPAIVGSWESTLLVAGQYNQLTVGDDMTGEARLYFYVDDEPYYADFTVLATEAGDDVFSVRFRCVGNCASYDFAADCFPASDGSEMTCTAGGAWTSYDFTWRSR